MTEHPNPRTPSTGGEPTIQLPVAQAPESGQDWWFSAYPPPSGPAYPLGAPAVAPAPPTRRFGVGMVLLALTAGLVGGVLGGGGAAYLVATRGSAPVVLPAPVPGVTTRPEGSIAQIAASALPSVVTIQIRSDEAEGTGSGFVIDSSGHILSNNHVVASVAQGGSITVELQDGSSASARVVGRDASYDLAVLKVDRAGLTPLQFGRSADVVVGDGVVAVGAPLGLEASVTSGIVSALNRPVAAGDGDETSYINAIQTDAAINPGNSGGPLLDMSGRVIGVNSAIARVPGTSGSSGSIGVGFSIPSDQAYKTAQQLISTGRAEHPMLGVRLDRSYDGEGAKILDSGGVSADSPAAQAGLRDGDVVIEFEGRRVADADALVVAVRAKGVGDTVRVTVRRDGQTVDLTLTLQAATTN